MDLAAANGHLEVIQWLHQHQSEGCTTDAMDAAAAAGNVDMVKWLHENRSEGCTSRAMEQATSIGRLDIAHYLHEQVGKRCTTAVLTNDATHGHLPILRWGWQWEEAWEDFSMDTLRDVAVNGHLDIVKFLVFEGGIYNDDEEVFEETSKAGRYAVLEWLLKIYMETSEEPVNNAFIYVPLNLADMAFD